ncbi:MAG: hypothetical protein KatS3mg001_380 [Candidatus Pacearchaeota archaeon]|nr:MAG: hypothetical protein KatS3mg001_380 [Candidatus Pacearchaeota archaeon]
MIYSGFNLCFLNTTENVNKNIFKENKHICIMSIVNDLIKINEKKGQGLSTNAIILIVLGVIVLVVLALGFTLGWNRILPFISQNNVENIKTACVTACTTQSVYDYCTANRTLKAEDLPGGVKEVKNTCNFFATNPEFSKYGIEVCSSITCPS